MARHCWITCIRTIKNINMDMDREITIEQETQKLFEEIYNLRKEKNREIVLGEETQTLLKAIYDLQSLEWKSWSIIKKYSEHDANNVFNFSSSLQKILTDHVLRRVMLAYGSDANVFSEKIVI